MRKDVRDRVLDAALDLVDARKARADLTRAMRLRPCERAAGVKGLECFMVVDHQADYCAACVVNAAVAEERRGVKRDEVRAFARLRTAARALRGSDNSLRYLPMFEARRAG